MNAAIDKLNEKLDAKRAEKKRTEEKIAKLQSRIDTEKARLDKLTADAETIEGEIIIQMVRSSDVSLSELPDILSVYQRSEPSIPAESSSAEMEKSEPEPPTPTVEQEESANTVQSSIYSNPFSASTR